ncbi:hypothetical protein SAMN04487944_102151 [Gracilibacillus ureilyticus]|uniref:Alpha/beta hydrolase n=1 Tax=Gracilibacillus ureilyticus TaxID=531814 RepID=A0A1H9MTJ8_9BACI|nr:alpha/beta hydrolase-fold protein [Gracilibacillus ureilyticus]SER26978.1 hypothetical protein SAMN04487944_102151 [Gracilibacillus ureilyticus]
MEAVVLQNAVQFSLKSREGRSYRIFVYQPDVPFPESGFPVLYLLDGNAVFGTVVDAVRLQSRRPEKTKIQPAVIVGIGYETDAPFSNERFYDYTLASPEIDVRSKWKGESLPEHGGAEEFLYFIEKKLKPLIERRYPVNQKNQSLFGHSLGGLFVLNTLFVKSHAFQNYIAGSPSIHWNETMLLENRDQYLNSVNSLDSSRSLFIGLGELERNHTTFMIENARKLANGLMRETSLQIDFKIFENENHISVLPPLINNAIKKALNTND